MTEIVGTDRGTCPRRTGLGRLMPLLAGAGLLALAGCADPLNPPLMFGQTESLGVVVSGSTAGQSGEFTVGYRELDFALVPVVIRQADGNYTQIRATAGDGFQDSLSVLGQFSANASGSGPDVGLGSFFATGTAAQKLADGFAARMGAERTTTNLTQPRHPAGGADLR
jgi:hypothetical protein